MSAIGPIASTPITRAIGTRREDPATSTGSSSGVAQDSVGSQPQCLDAQSQLCNMQEEMSDVLAQFSRAQVRRVATRRSEDSERILDRDVDEKLDELNTVIETSKPDARQLLGDTRQRFADVSDMLLALRELRRLRRVLGAPIDVIEEAIDELMAQADPKLLTAGVNVALKAKVFGRALSVDAGELRQLYRQLLLFEGTYLTIYESWIERFGVKRRRRILAFVQQALSYDMQALDPSCSCAAEFGPLLALLGKIRRLNYADERFVLAVCQGKPAVDADQLESLALACLFSVLRLPESATECIARLLTPALGPLSARDRSYAIQCMLRAAASLPLAVFDASEDRHALIDAFKAMADAPFAAERRALRLAGS